MQVRIDAQELKQFMIRLFIELGFPPQGAEIGADSLVWANLRGVDSHGVLRFPWFLQLARDGHLKPEPDIQVVRETPAIVVIDADRGLGAVTATLAMRRAMEKAKQVGIGWALLTNTVTPLCIGYFTHMATQADMVGIAATYDRPNMAPYGAKTPGLHNGPLSIAVPARDHRPVLLDMATSVVARGKIDYAIDKGTPIPEGWALDADSNPTTDAHQARIMLPFGGYKGSDLGFMLECLCNIMAGDPRAGPFLLNKGHDLRHRQNSVMAAIDVAAFTDVETYKARVADLIKGVKGLPKAEGFDEILVAGEPEDKFYDDRSRRGIPLPQGTVRRLREAAEQLGVEVPPAF
jgi:ureidoglycolate dehydrogenase (NAD+)